MRPLSPRHASPALAPYRQCTTLPREKDERIAKAGPGGRTGKQPSVVNKFRSRQPSELHSGATLKRCPPQQTIARSQAPPLALLQRSVLTPIANIYAFLFITSAVHLLTTQEQRSDQSQWWWRGVRGILTCGDVRLCKMANSSAVSGRLC